MKFILSALFTLILVSAFAIVPPKFKMSDFQGDIRFSGIVTIYEAQAIFDDKDEVCAVSYRAKVNESIYGAKKGDLVNLHMYKDIRKFDFDFLEVGAEHFIYAESLDTHRFVQLSDGLYRFPEYTEKCDGEKESFFVYREFSGKVKNIRKQTYIVLLDCT